MSSGRVEAQFQSAQQQNAQQQQHQQLQPPPTMQTMRLRDEPPTITTPARNSRKRKSPASSTPASAPLPPPPPQPTHILPPPHALIHAPPPHMQGPPPPLPPGYQYGPADYTPGGMPPHQPPPPPPHAQPDGQQPEQDGSPSGSNAGRALSSSKRAEQNRKAQRAFRERRDQHVKALESRSQLLDAALASADEANRRWEECRALVDQLRIENAALRAALSQAQMLPPSGQGQPGGPGAGANNGAHQEEAARPGVSNEFKNDSSGDSAAANVNSDGNAKD